MYRCPCHLIDRNSIVLIAFVQSSKLNISIATVYRKRYKKDNFGCQKGVLLTVVFNRGFEATKTTDNTILHVAHALSNRSNRCCYLLEPLIRTDSREVYIWLDNPADTAAECLYDASGSQTCWGIFGIQRFFVENTCNTLVSTVPTDGQATLSHLQLHWWPSTKFGSRGGPALRGI